MPIEKSERSIIKIIAEMVREGETEEKIIRNLCELGAMEDEARRMVLIAQAQTYDSLKEEISRIVESNISAEKPFLRDFLKKQISETAKRKVLPGPEEKQKKPGFFSRLFGIFSRKKAKQEIPSQAPQFEMPTMETAEISQPQETLEELSEEIREKPLVISERIEKAKRKKSLLSALKTKNEKEIKEMQKAKKKGKLSKEEAERKSELMQKNRDYEQQIKQLQKALEKEKTIERPEEREISPSMQAAQATMQAASEVPAAELASLQDLAAAAKAINLAAKRIVLTAPKPKIVISQGEGELTTEQQIEQLKRMQKLLEIDFYKRRISLDDYKNKMMEYQSRLYELVEKKRILEKTKRLPKKQMKKISKELEETIEKKLEGRMSEQRMTEIEETIAGLLQNYKVPEAAIAKEIKEASADALTSNLEKFVKLAALQQEAKKTIEEKGGFPAAAGTAQAPTIVIGGTQTIQGSETKTIQRAEKIPVQRRRQKAAAKPKKAGRRFWSRKQGENVIIVQTPSQQQTSSQQQIPENEQTIRIERAAEETGRLPEEPKEIVRIRPVGEEKFYKRVEGGTRRILAESEKTWEEAEIPSFPETLEKKEKEKLETKEKEIQRYRIITDLDGVYQIIKERGIIAMDELEKEAGIEKKRMEELMDILEEQKMIRLQYPAFGAVKVMHYSYKPEKHLPKEKKTNEEKKQEQQEKKDEQKINAQQKADAKTQKATAKAQKKEQKKTENEKNKKPFFGFGQKKNQ
ncbi:MAG TPA: hypothetical protein VI977_00990 [archaeon]|nr:hypothetical protein [archaeon]